MGNQIIQSGRIDRLQRDWFASLSECHSEKELLTVLPGICDELGFEYVAYGARLPVLVENSQTLMLNNYPDEWQNYLAIDPSVAHALSSVKPITWNDELFKDRREFQEDAQSHGLKHGWAQPVNDGRICALVSFARSESPLGSKELHANYENQVWLAHAIHTFMETEVINKKFPEMTVSLTLRESEVLKWTAEGKTAEEVGVILSISTRTVHFHVSNVMTKLNAYNKTSATIKAVKLGLI